MSRQTTLLGADAVEVSCQEQDGVRLLASVDGETVTLNAYDGPRPTHYIALSPEDADDLADQLRACAMGLRLQRIDAREAEALMDTIIGRMTSGSVEATCR